MHVRGIVGSYHIWTKLLKASLALRASAVRIYHAAYCGKVAGVELGDCRANLCDTADYLVSGNAGIDGSYAVVAPLVTNCVEIRVANTAKQNFNLNIIFARLAPGDCSESKRRYSTCSRVSLSFILTTRFRAKLYC